MYRYVRHTPLDTGHKYGDILKDGDLKPETIRLFLSTGTLIQVSSPPLSEIPAFEKRAVELAEFNIITVKNLAEADAVILARKIGKSATTIRRWQTEAMQWLQPDRPKKKSG
jgi:hypothetical protein